MNFIDLAQTRRSIRSYKDTPVEKEKIEKCLEAARLSPSSTNSQPWKFIVINEPELKKKVADASENVLGVNKFAHQSPVIVAVVAERLNFLSKVGELKQKKDYIGLNIGLATSHFCLQAAELGLGTCILGLFDENKIQNLLGVPTSKRIVLLLTLGYAAKDPKPINRKEVNEISSWNKY